MYSTQKLLSAIQYEFNILKHLGTKVTAENANFKLSDAQRTTQEVQHYIVSSLPIQIKLFVAGVFDNDAYGAYASQFEGFTFEQFSEKLDSGYADIKAALETVTDEQYDEVVTLWGRTAPRSTFLVDYVLEFLGAYKMQLFLQLKASGLHNLSTMNLWAGIDGNM